MERCACGQLYLYLYDCIKDKAFNKEIERHYIDREILGRRLHIKDKIRRWKVIEELVKLNFIKQKNKVIYEVVG